MAGKLGMGLLETLLENLDRDLNLADTTLTNPTITTSAASTFSGGLVANSGGSNFLVNNFKYLTTASGNHDFSSLVTGNHTIMVNVAKADGTYIQLPEATTSNGGMHIRVIMGLAPADNLIVGFKTSVIVGGASTFSDGAVGLQTQNGAFVVSAAATVNHSVNLDENGAAGDGGGSAGSVLDFYYPGVANVIIYRGNLIGNVDSATLANHFSTAEVDA